MALYTQKAIMRTFQQMLEEMPFDKITVSALVRRCEISSNTFYYHYRDIYDLLDTWFHAQFDPFMQCDSPDFSWRVSVKALLRECKAKPKVIYHVFDTLSRDQLEQYVFSLSDDVFLKTVQRYADVGSIPEDDLKSITSFCRFAFIGFFLQFLWNRMEDDIDESVDRLAVIFRYFLKSSADCFAQETSGAPREHT